MHATPKSTPSARQRTLVRGAIATALGGAISLVSVAPAMAATPGEQLDAAIAGAESQVAAVQGQVNAVSSALQSGDVAGAVEAAAPGAGAAINQALPEIPTLPAAPALPTFEAPVLPKIDVPAMPQPGTTPAAPALPTFEAPALPKIDMPQPGTGSSAPDVEMPNIAVPPVDISSQLGTGNPAVDDALRQIESAVNRTISQITSPSDEGINRPVNIPGVGVIKRDPASGDFYLYPESGYMGPKDLAFGFIGPDGNGHLGWITIRTPGGGTAGVGAGNGGVDVGIQGKDEGRGIHITRDGAQVVDRGPVAQQGQAANNLTVNPSSTPTSDPTGGGDPYNPQNPTSPYNPDNPSSPYNPQNPDSPLYGDPEDKEAATRQADAIAAQQAQQAASDPTTGGGDNDDVESTELPGLRDVSDEDAEGEGEETERVSLPGLRESDDETMTLAERSREAADEALRDGASALPGLSSTTDPEPTTTPGADDDAEDPTSSTEDATSETTTPSEGKDSSEDTKVDAKGDEDDGMSTGAKVGIGAGILAAVAAVGAAVGLRRKPTGAHATSVTADNTTE